MYGDTWLRLSFGVESGGTIEIIVGNDAVRIRFGRIQGVRVTMFVDQLVLNDPQNFRPNFTDGMLAG